jgi:PAS domain S-box-containing protein
MNSLIRILLIDDSPYFLVAARDFLAMHKVFEIVGEVQDGTNALARALEIQPDVILLDLNLGSESGMELIPLLKKHLPLTRIVVLTIQDEPGYRAASLEAGADAFVNKMHMTQDLIATIFSIMKDPLISKEQTASLQKERDAMFLRLIENADDLIYRYEFSPRRGFTYVNAAAETITGYAPEEHYADPDLGFKLIYPEDRPLLEQALLGKLEPHQPLILRWVRKDGSIFWTEQRNVNIYNGQGDLIAIEGIARDITHRIQMEELLKVSEQFTREALDSLKNHIAILDETGAIVMVNRSWREFAGINGVDADAVSEGINYLSVCDTATGEGSHQAAAMAAGIRSVMRGELESYFLEYPCHSPDEKRWFIVRVTKFKGEQPLRIVVDHENLTEQKINEQAIVRSEARYRELFEANPHPMWVYDLETLQFLAVNDAAILHYGYTHEQFYSMTIKDIRPPADVERLLENISQVNNGADEAGIWSHIKKNGDVIQVEITSHVIDFGGRRAEIVLANDVTERLRAEQERDRLFNYSIDMLCIADFNGYFKQLNPAWEKTLGWTTKELQSKPYLDYVHPEDHEATINAKGSLVDGKTIFTFENRYLCRDGTYKWISWNSYPLVEEELIFGVAHDVTERKHAEEALRASEARYRALIDQLPAIVYLDDLQISPPKTQFVSPRVQEILGYTPEEWLAGGFDLWKDSLHPDDKEDVVRHYFDSIEKDSDYSLDYRIVTRMGDVIWVHDSAAIQRNADGKPLNMQGVVYDISERKNAETVMRLQSAALESADNAIIISDRQGNIQWVNSAYTRLTGYTRNEVFGKNPRILRSGMQNDTFYKNLWDTILSGKVWRGELVNKRKDGTLYNEEQTITPLFDETGEVTHFIGIKQDITHRKRIEEQVHQQIERLTALQQIDRAIAATFDIKVSLNILLSAAQRLLSADAVDILLINPITHSFEYVSCLGFRSESSKLENVKLGKSYAGLVAQDRRMTYIPNIMLDSKNLFSEEFLKEENFVNYHGVPLIVKGRLLGVMEVFHRSNVEREDDWLDFLETLGGQAAIAVDNAQLFQDIQRSSQEMMIAYDATIEGWSRAMDLRDEETEGHTQRVTELSLRLAEKMGVSDQERVQMRRGALLHDIGKLGVPDNILLKPGKLTDEEWVIMKQHPVHAYEMLLPIKYLRPALDIPYAHHEKWDGTGYPRGLKGEQIPLPARIFAIVDVWDALRSDRPYRKGWEPERIREHILEQSGKHFDPQVVRAFMELMQEDPGLG